MRACGRVRVAYSNPADSRVLRWVSPDRGFNTNERLAMTEDNYNLNEVHPELADIIEGAESQIMSDVTTEVLLDFKMIEQGMWEQMGDPDGIATVWTVNILADNMADAMDKQVELGDSIVQLNKPDDIDEPEAGLMGIHLIAQSGNLYSELLKPSTMLAVAEADPVGLIVRVGGFSSAEANDKGIRPSEADDREDVVVTVLCTNAVVYTIMRSVSNPDKDLVIDTKPVFEVTYGESKLIDAVMMTYMAPQVVRGSGNEEMYQEFLDALRKRDTE